MSEWKDISEATDADKTGCIVAAWSHERSAYSVGEAHCIDGEWWWANQGPGDYYADTITNGGLMPVKFQPLPSPPARTQGE